MHLQKFSNESCVFVLCYLAIFTAVILEACSYSHRSTKNNMCHWITDSFEEFICDHTTSPK